MPETGGAFVEFKLSSGFSLNPFDMVDGEALSSDADGEDYEVECLAMLKSIVGQMARQQDRLTDTERGLIDFMPLWAGQGCHLCEEQPAAVLLERWLEQATALLG